MYTGPVTGKEFFDRGELMSSLKKNIHHLNHALIGPRGCGKSSILQQLAKMKKVDGFVPVYVNLGYLVPKTHRATIRKIGRETLRAVARRKGLTRTMPAILKDKASKLSDFVRDNLRVKIGDWATLYFDPDSDLTDLMEETFSTIESYDVRPLIMLDEITELVKLVGPRPKREDMDFMVGLREHISNATNARYILSGSQLGVMRLIVTAKFARHLTPVNVGGLEEDGADEFFRKKTKRKISAKLVKEIKKRTRLWPLYLRAYCHALNLRGSIPKRSEELDDTVFNVLHGHLSYLENQLSEKEIMVLRALDGGKVSTVASKLESSYDAALSIFRVLELKGFVEKASSGVYKSVDPIFLVWLKKKYPPPEEWR